MLYIGPYTMEKVLCKGLAGFDLPRAKKISQGREESSVVLNVLHGWGPHPWNNHGSLNDGDAR